MRPCFSIFLPAVATVAAALLGTACSRRAGTDATAAKDAPCVLLVTVEQLRADHLGAYGATNSFTPVLDSLAASGTRFDDLQAVAPLSLTAHASLLTGLQPPEHGLRVPGGGPLSPEAPTLATVLRAKGYRTAAFLANPDLGGPTGLDRGFDRYDVPSGEGPTNTPARPSRLAERLRPRAFPSEGPSRLRRGEAVADAAIAWLAEVAGMPLPYAASNRRTADGPKAAAPKKPARLKKPFFLWVQLSDPLFRDGPDRTRFGGGRLASSYDAEVAYLDLQLGRLLASLDQVGLRDRTLVVVAGSHGTELGPDAGDDPGLVLSDDTLHVPGILRFPDGIPSPTVTDTTLSQTALAPTVTVLAGFPDAFTAPVAGRAIGVLPPEVPAYSESLWPQHAYGLPALERWEGKGQRPDFDTTHAAAPLPVLPESGFQLVGTVPRGDFVRLWRRVARRMRNPSASDETLLEDCQRLAEGRPDHAPFQTWLGIALALRKQPAEAVAAHRRALDLVPGDTYLTSNLGLAYLEAGDIAKAIDLMENAYLAKPGDPDLRDNLATVLMNTGVALARNKAFDDAMACMTRVLFLQPDNPFAHINMGSVYQHMDRADLAAASYRRALELRPGFKPAELALRSLQSKEKP